MNPFVEHHQQSIRFQYSCFDRMLLNAVVAAAGENRRLPGQVSSGAVARTNLERDD